MRKINPAYKEFTLEKPIAEAKEIIITKFLQLKGKVVRNDKTQIECKFGSHLKSKLLCELFFPGSTLPKKAVIKFSEIESNQTHIAVQVTDTHKLGFKASFVKNIRKR